MAIKELGFLLLWNSYSWLHLLWQVQTKHSLQTKDKGELDGSKTSLQQSREILKPVIPCLASRLESGIMCTPNGLGSPLMALLAVAHTWPFPPLESLCPVDFFGRHSSFLELLTYWNFCSSFSLPVITSHIIYLGDPDTVVHRLESKVLFSNSISFVPVSLLYQSYVEKCHVPLKYRSSGPWSLEGQLWGNTSLGCSGWASILGFQFQGKFIKINYNFYTLEPIVAEVINSYLWHFLLIPLQCHCLISGAIATSTTKFFLSPISHGPLLWPNYELIFTSNYV